ncbi:MAG TPA: vWA domain-containing protein [Bdellovibrionales bacterium]|nr:vWA domain-containing protein [Bdellovibrionales bacterium]
MRSRIYLIIGFAALTSACAPNEFAFEQAGNGPICVEGCSNQDGTIRYSYFETVTGDRRVDILVVDDNSGSMAEEQANMAMRFPNFIAGLNSTMTGGPLEWRLGITTTDVSNGAERGQLVTFSGSTLKYIDQNTPNADQLFKDTVQMGTGGDGDERGIYAANLAVDRNEDNWIRQNSHFAVIVLSDENERSTGANLENYDRPQTFIDNVRAKLGAAKSFSFHSIITRPNDQACLDGDGTAFGTVYAELSNLTGGIIGDICAADYGAQLQDIAELISSNVDSFGLKCAPIGGTVAVEYNPAPPGTITTVVENNLIRFSQPLPAGTQVRLTYDCKK